MSLPAGQTKGIWLVKNLCHSCAKVASENNWRKNHRGNHTTIQPGCTPKHCVLPIYLPPFSLHFSRWPWVSLCFFLILFQRITDGDKWHGFFTGQMSFLSPNQQCQSTEGNTTCNLIQSPFITGLLTEKALTPALRRHWLNLTLPHMRERSPCYSNEFWSVPTCRMRNRLWSRSIPQPRRRAATSLYVTLRSSIYSQQNQHWQKQFTS